MERVNTNRRNEGLIKAVAVVAIIGAINWGLIGFFNWNLVDAIFGGGAREQTNAIGRLIYSIVGLAGLALAITFPWRRPMASMTSATTPPLTGGGIDRQVDIRP